MAYDVPASTAATTARGSQAARTFRNQLLFAVHARDAMPAMGCGVTADAALLKPVSWVLRRRSRRLALRPGEGTGKGMWHLLPGDNVELTPARMDHAEYEAYIECQARVRPALDSQVAMAEGGYVTVGDGIFVE
jgi:hypothetical protein